MRARSLLVLLGSVLVSVLGSVLGSVLVSACDDGIDKPDIPPPPVVSHLDVVKAGDGAGIVRTLPAGLICDTTCDGAGFDYEDSDVITVVAELGRNANFKKLTCTSEGQDDVVALALDDGSDDTASVEIAGIVDGVGLTWTCEADFSLVHTIQILATNAGGGVVKGSLSAVVGAAEPRRIDCATHFEEPDVRVITGDSVGAYFDGDVETLTATPDVGSLFVEWDTCASSLDDPTNPVQVISVVDDLNCRAVFAFE